VDELKRYKATKAIIMAAGRGSRLSPITDTIPKPLIEVNGRRMIETLLDALIQNGVSDIYIVTGYLKEQFDYLPQKYSYVNITLLFNPYYLSCNNISSLYIARAYLGNCIIADGDLIIYNPHILEPYFDASGYCSIWAEETNEWLQTTDGEGYVVSCSRSGGKKGWQLFSISFWSENDGQKLCRHIEEIFVERAITDIFWDDVPMFYFKDEYRLKIRQIQHNDLVEIDNLSELSIIDPKIAEVII